MYHPNENYRKLLLAVQRENIPYALLRDNMASREPIRDLDVLIDRRKRKEFYRVASEQGFVLVKEGVLNPGKRVYVKLEDGRSFILDIHEKIVWRGIEFLDSDRALANRKPDDGFYYLCGEDFLLSLLFHNVLAKGCIQEKHKPELTRLLQKPLDRRYLGVQLRTFGLRGIFESLENNFTKACEDSAFVKEIAKKARRRLMQRNPANPLRLLGLWLRERTIKLIGKKRGIVVAFLGPDGAGKSTTIKAIDKRLKTIGLGSKIVYLGPWGGSILPLRGLLSFLHLTPYRDDYKAHYKGRLAEKPGPLKGLQKIRFQIRSGLYYLLLMLEMSARWLWLVKPLLRQGRVVLCDRYIYDMLTGYKNKPMDYHIELRRGLCSRYPKPDTGILLDAAPGVIFARKPQLSREELTRSRAAYREIAEMYGFFTLDTSESVETTVQDFEEHILPRILAKLTARKHPQFRSQTTFPKTPACEPVEL